MRQPSTPTRSPTKQLLRGEISGPILVISIRDVRSAELLSHDTELLTADGVVLGRPGDVVITMPQGGERYPILKSVFYGAYQIIGQSQNHVVAQRIMHIRRAWPVISDDAEFNYGADRGRVTVARGGWLYQSDDDDFGLINASVKHTSHTEVGSERAIAGQDWAARYRIVTLGLTFLPPVLTLLALLAFAQPEVSNVASKSLPSLLLALETVLIAAGVALFGWLRADKWTLKASVKSGLELARRFQPAVELLGQRPSIDFPNMTLWRAAQDPETGSPCARVAPTEQQQALLLKIKQEIAALLESIRASLHRHHRQERLATGMTLTAVSMIIVCNCLLTLMQPSHRGPAAGAGVIELLAIWIPSLIGSIHAFHFRRRTSQHGETLSEFRAQLEFVKVRIYAPVPEDDHSARQALCANLRLLCKIIAHYNQREIEYALADQPQVPV